MIHRLYQLLPLILILLCGCQPNGEERPVRIGLSQCTLDDAWRQAMLNDVRIEACGTLDELSSHLGWLAANAPEAYRPALHEVQRRLFAIGSLAAGYAKATYVPGPTEEANLQTETQRLEATCGRFSGFILPGGCPLAAQTHVCRTVCRRAERQVVGLGHLDHVVPYLNRLSSYLYALARHFNAISGVAEIKL